MLIPCFYNAPISYYALLIQESEAIDIEFYDHYSKQTYRNRCKILGANRVIDLVIPVVKVHGSKMHMKDVLIDYDTQWNKNHWRSIFSAYSSAPFFEFFDDAYQTFYSKNYKYLIDLNIELLAKTLEILESGKEIIPTESYQHETPNIDAREAIHPKKEFNHSTYSFHSANYQQVFSDRHGFKHDLSIIDLLFNEGPNARMILKGAISKKKV
jgi:hypothetical protein